MPEGSVIRAVILTACPEGGHSGSGSATTSLQALCAAHWEATQLALPLAGGMKAVMAGVESATAGGSEEVDP